MKRFNKVIRLLSLKSTKKSTSRISYAKLGIGQLGAVYETLISFTGIVAETDLIQIDPQRVQKSEKKSNNSESGDNSAVSSENEEQKPNLDEIWATDDGFAKSSESDSAGHSVRNDIVDKLAPCYFVTNKPNQ